jgi:hypothetical protein
MMMMGFTTSVTASLSILIVTVNLFWRPVIASEFACVVYIPASVGPVVPSVLAHDSDLVYLRAAARIALLWRPADDWRNARRDVKHDEAIYLDGAFIALAAAACLFNLLEGCSGTHYRALTSPFAVLTGKPSGPL